MKEKVHKHWLKQEELEIIWNVPTPSNAFVYFCSEGVDIADK